MRRGKERQRKGKKNKRKGKKGEKGKAPEEASRGV